MPEGILRNENPLQDWETAPDVLVSALQIFSYNLLSVAAVIIANLFASRRSKDQIFVPLGYVAFFLMISLNAVVLGTWSFSVVTRAVPLLSRITRTFDLLHRAGLWEMSGQLLIVCATAKASFVFMDGRETITRSCRSINLTRQDVLVLALGLVLIMVGAIVESYAIIDVA